MSVALQHSPKDILPCNKSTQRVNGAAGGRLKTCEDDRSLFNATAMHGVSQIDPVMRHVAYILLCFLLPRLDSAEANQALGHPSSAYERLGKGLVYVLHASTLTSSKVQHVGQRCATDVVYKAIRWCCSALLLMILIIVGSRCSSVLHASN